MRCFIQYFDESDFGPAYLECAPHNWTGALPPFSESLGDLDTINAIANEHRAEVAKRLGSADS